MISKKDIIKMARHVTRRGSNIPDNRLMHPYREWFIGLSGAILIAIVGAGYNATVFSHYNSLEGQIAARSLETVKYQREVAERVLEYYGARAEVFSARKEGLTTPQQIELELDENTEETLPNVP